MNDKTGIIYDETKKSAPEFLSSNESLSPEYAQGHKRYSLSCPDAAFSQMGQTKKLSSAGTSGS